MKRYLHPYDGSEIIHMDEQDMIDEEWKEIYAEEEERVRSNLDVEMIREAIGDMDGDAIEDLFRAYTEHDSAEVGFLVTAAIDRYVEACVELRVKANRHPRSGT